MSIIDIPEGTDEISVKKQINDLLRKIQEESKPDTCIICGKKQTSFCNSHSVPRMVIKNIADNGRLYHANKLIDMPIVDTGKGVNNSVTFHFICRDCDSVLFQDYENLDALQGTPDDKMLAEIALKDVLLMLSKRNQEQLLYQMRKMKGTIKNVELMEEIQQLDINDYRNEMNLYKSIIDNASEDNFKVILWEKVPYTIPVAAQSLIAMPKDIEGNEINNVNDMNPNVRMQNIHIGVFPLNGFSIAYAFYHRQDKLYRRLHHQMNCLSLEKKLEYIIFWIFKYTENYYISPKVKSVIETDTKLQELSRDNNDNPNLGYISLMELMNPRDEIHSNDSSNLLLKKYAI
ncbi:MAG: hypothetical protein UEA60_07780 [Lachnospiraceae bacterium]|nr:hypothetical protein [Lachnospiraceae bacterium]